MAKVKCVKFKELICPETKRKMTFKKPVAVIFRQSKRRCWMFECQGAKLLWDYGRSEQECQKYFASMAFDLYDIIESDARNPERLRRHGNMVADERDVQWAEACKEWRDKIMDVKAP